MTPSVEINLQEKLLNLLRCPQKTAGVRCGAVLEVKDGGKLVCQKCQKAYSVVKGVPVMHGDAEGDYYDGAYSERSRTSDLAKGYYAVDREHVRGWIAEFKLQGPSLEIGAATCCFGEDLPEYVGMDLSLQSLLSDGTAGFNRVCGSAESLPFKDQSFDCIFSLNTLEHVPEVDLAFLEIDRVLRPGGVAILRPAWHCTSYQTELLPIKKYKELNLRQKITKAMLPVLTSKPWKAMTHLPPRVLRRGLATWPTKLKFGRLTPNYEHWISDSDATSSIDSHEAILFFESRGYEPMMHRTLKRKIMAGHDWVLMRKPAKV